VRQPLEFSFELASPLLTKRSAPARRLCATVFSVHKLSLGAPNWGAVGTFKIGRSGFLSYTFYMLVVQADLFPKRIFGLLFPNVRGLYRSDPGPANTCFWLHKELLRRA